MSRATQHYRRQRRHEEAMSRNEAWAALTPYQQLKHLVERGHGHCKQAQRLSAAGATKLPPLEVS